MYVFYDKYVNIHYTYMNFVGDCTMYISVVYKHGVHTTYIYICMFLFLREP